MDSRAGQVPSLSVEGHVATLCLNRPDRANRLGGEDLVVIRQSLELVDANPEVRVLCLTARGRYFCSGFDVNKVGGDDAGAMFEAAAQALERARPLTIVAIHGGIYGGATDLALACDFRFGVRGINMFVPAAEIGLHFYGSGLERYVSRLGLATAKRVLLAGERLDADQMLAAGFLDRLVESPEELQNVVDQFSRHLATMAPLAVQGMKRSLNQIARGALDLSALHRDIAQAQTSKDLVEGVRAKAEKRQPVFVGA